MNNLARTYSKIVCSAAPDSLSAYETEWTRPWSGSTVVSRAAGTFVSDGRSRTGYKTRLGTTRTIHITAAMVTFSIRRFPTPRSTYRDLPMTHSASAPDLLQTVGARFISRQSPGCFGIGFWPTSGHRKCPRLPPTLAFDPSGPHQTRIVASSTGHLLASQLLDGHDVADKREALVRRLLAPDMLTGPGIRTKSTTAPRFRPGAYHNGSVWPMDTGVIADGLRRHRRVAEADDLEDRILTACIAVGSPVEFFRGEPDGSIAINTSTVVAFRDGELRVTEQPP